LVAKNGDKESLIKPMKVDDEMKIGTDLIGEYLEYIAL
jgi:hypothetical protein